MPLPTQSHRAAFRANWEIDRFFHVMQNGTLCPLVFNTRIPAHLERLKQLSPNLPDHSRSEDEEKSPGFTFQYQAHALDSVLPLILIPVPYRDYQISVFSLQRFEFKAREPITIAFQGQLIDRASASKIDHDHVLETASGSILHAEVGNASHYLRMPLRNRTGSLAQANMKLIQKSRDHFSHPVFAQKADILSGHELVANYAGTYKEKYQCPGEDLAYDGVTLAPILIFMHTVLMKLLHPTHMQAQLVVFNAWAGPYVNRSEHLQLLLSAIESNATTYNDWLSRTFHSREVARNYTQLQLDAIKEEMLEFCKASKKRNAESDSPCAARAGEPAPTTPEGVQAPTLAAVDLNFSTEPALDERSGKRVKGHSPTVQSLLFSPEKVRMTMQASLPFEPSELQMESPTMYIPS